MTQRQISHPDPIPACPKGHPARLIHDQRRYTAGGGYFVECRCCATRKALAADAAAQEWRRMHRLRGHHASKAGGPGQPDMFVDGRSRAVFGPGTTAA